MNMVELTFDIRDLIRKSMDLLSKNSPILIWDGLKLFIYIPEYNLYNSFDNAYNRYMISLNKVTDISKLEGSLNLLISEIKDAKRLLQSKIQELSEKHDALKAKYDAEKKTEFEAEKH